MQDSNETIPSKRNPLLWIGLIMVGLILYVLIGGDREPSRGDAVPPATVADSSSDSQDEIVAESLADGTGTIDRALLIPPGMRAREYIAQLREQGKPYPLDEARDKASAFHQDGSLADSYLLYFFAAREGDAQSMLEIARLNDPRYFKPDNALLDEPDAVQALKWYRLAQQSDAPEASGMLASLRDWAEAEAASGSEVAEQILLNFR